MKFLRLRIANYRGVPSAEVRFSPLGITLIQGPNEAGKTSLGEAIGLLFEYPDNSKHRAVEAVRPVHRDEGAEIELEAESGPYRFTYFKRFHKKPETRLAIARPKAENLTGREAHDRAAAILEETLDVTLWKALTIQQGDAVRQPSLASQTSLSAALDKAAGGQSADPRQEDLFETVREEFLRYYTERGAEKKELNESRNAVAAAEAESARFARVLADLEQDIERAAVLQQELARLKKQEAEQTAEVDRYKLSLEEIAALEKVLSEARLKLESARKTAQAARKEKEHRKGLIDAVANADRERKGLQEEFQISSESLKRAEDEFARAKEVLAAAEQERKEADTVLELRRADFDYYNNRLHLEQMQERKERIDAARQRAAEAGQTLAANKVDERKLKSIRNAERELLMAGAQLATAAPGVRLRALADCRLIVDSEETRIGQGETRTFSVPEKLKLSLPELLEIEIAAGSSAEALAQKVEEVRLALEKACAKAGVSTPEEAQAAYEEHEKAKRQLEELERVEKETLRDLSYEELDRKLRGLQQSVPAYLERRAAEPPIAPDLEASKAEKAGAESFCKEANAAWDAARDAFEAARTVRDGLNGKHQELKVKIELLSRDLEQAGENLGRARKSLADEAVDGELEKAIGAVAAEEANVRDSEAMLEARNPERVRLLDDTARGSLLTTQKRRGAAQTEMTEVQTRLKMQGEEGLHEKLQAARANAERLAAGNASLARRAQAAKCLFETMREERDRVRRAYVAPLKEKVEALGRLVFDDSFGVEIGDDLQIASRRLDGVSVPFESLSGGTKEQLSLVFRLACSMIVADREGTPLILDDALGYTDPQRLHLVGAVLSRAAKCCQIIVFTCMPERYANVGEANVVQL